MNAALNLETESQRIVKFTFLTLKYFTIIY